METNKWFIGIDVSAKYVDVCWTGDKTTASQHLQIEQGAKGWRQLKRKLLKTGVMPAQAHVVMEATSTYWMSIAHYLVACGMQVYVVNPRQAHHFAESYQRHNKTDQVDAELLMRMGIERHEHLPRWMPPPACYEELYERLVLRESLLDAKLRLANVRHSFSQRPYLDSSVMRQLDEQIDQLACRVDALKAQIVELLMTGQWAQMAQHILSIKGMGPLTTAWLLIATVGFTTCMDREQLAGYAGLAPREHRSGSSIHRRAKTGPGGHARLRRHVFMAARSACVHNPRIRSFYQRLVDRGKPKKVAHCAAARKLLGIAFALVKKGEDYRCDYPLPQAISS
jgi:transposase